LRQKYQTNSSGFAFDNLGSFKISEKQIEARVKEQKKIRLFHKALQMRID
jgi:hypothetical protein